MKETLTLVKAIIEHVRVVHTVQIILFFVNPSSHRSFGDMGRSIFEA
jgi:hypothetical protein